MVCKKGGKLKAAERWRTNGQNIEVVDKFNHLGVTLENTGGWNKQQTLSKTKEYQDQMYISNPQHKHTDVTEHIQNGR